MSRYFRCAVLLMLLGSGCTGAPNSGGTGGTAGASVGGSATGGATIHSGGSTSTSGGGATSGVACGTKLCAAGQYCCNASCSMCAPMGAACIQIACDPVATGGSSSQSCTLDSDCRLFDSYCGGCSCLALGKTAADPTCAGNTVNCIAAPCMNKTARCTSGQCGIGG